MFYADEIGLGRVLERIRDFGRRRHRDPDFWKPAPLLVRLADSGERFNVG
jgi:3-hydroxyacyl-CoA dehydrogenase